MKQGLTHRGPHHAGRRQCFAPCPASLASDGRTRMHPRRDRARALEVYRAYNVRDLARIDPSGTAPRPRNEVNVSPGMAERLSPWHARPRASAVAC
ncbi:MAG: hypothetical protein ACLSVD_11040 [Eggerthellaceae bacterium]